MKFSLLQQPGHKPSGSATSCPQFRQRGGSSASSRNRPVEASMFIRLAILWIGRGPVNSARREA
jgi:hypothetical protein